MDGEQTAAANFLQRVGLKGLDALAKDSLEACRDFGAPTHQDSRVHSHVGYQDPSEKNRRL